MAFIAIPGAVAVTVNQLLDDQRVQNTLYFEQEPFNTDFVVSDLESLAEAVFDWYSAIMLPGRSRRLILSNVEAIDLSSQFANGASYSLTNPPEGAVADISMPGNVALCITFRTQSRGRRARGRNYIGGLPRLALDGVNTVLQSTATAEANGYSQVEAHVNGITSATWRHIVASRADGIGARYPVTDYVIRDLILDSQRRRLPGRGA